ncbi:MAG: hypothetical protein AB8B62_08310 [Roseobacter sp.]
MAGIVNVFSLALGCALAGIAMWFWVAVSIKLSMFKDAVNLPELSVTVHSTGFLGGSAFMVNFRLWPIAWPEHFRPSCSIDQQLNNSDHVRASHLAGTSRRSIFRLRVLTVILPYLLSLGAISVDRNALSIAILASMDIGIAPPQAK